MVVATVAANTTSYSNTGLTPSTTYTYQVQAFNSAGSSPLSNTVTATTKTAPFNLLAPGNVTALMLAADQVQVKWTDTSTNETSFLVQRSANGTIWSTVATAVANATNITVTGTLAAGVKYRYRVVAVNGTTAGPVSATALIDLTGHPTSPATLAATSTTAKTVNLTWGDTSINNDSFAIQYKRNGTAIWNTAGVVGANATSYTHTGLTTGQTYEYRVWAVNAAGRNVSSTVSVVVQ